MVSGVPSTSSSNRGQCLYLSPIAPSEPTGVLFAHRGLLWSTARWRPFMTPRTVYDTANPFEERSY
jgi:hypothetical protein